VWERELGLPLELASVSAVSHKFTTEDITAVIGVSGELVGNVLYGFPKSTARGIIDIMVGADDEIDLELALSALGELANMVTGNAATELSSSGFSLHDRSAGPHPVHRDRDLDPGQASAPGRIRQRRGRTEHSCEPVRREVAAFLGDI